jgi:hypothetical protein
MRKLLTKRMCFVFIAPLSTHTHTHTHSWSSRYQPKRIPRRRQRIYDEKKAQVERLIDTTRAVLVFTGYVVGSATLYYASLSDKMFGLKVVGVTVLCYLSSIPLDDPRGDKTNPLTIVYSRKTALLVIYIWVWVCAMDWTSRLLWGTEHG